MRHDQLLVFDTATTQEKNRLYVIQRASILLVFDTATLQRPTVACI